MGGTDQGEPTHTVFLMRAIAWRDGRNFSKKNLFVKKCCFGRTSPPQSQNPTNKVPLDSPLYCASNGTLDCGFGGFPAFEVGYLRFCQLTKKHVSTPVCHPVCVRPATMVPFYSPFNCLSTGYRFGGAAWGLWALSGLTMETDSLRTNFQ